MFGNTYLHKTFTEYVSNQYTHFDMLTFQMSLQVMERFLIFAFFKELSYIIYAAYNISSPDFNKL